VLRLKGRQVVGAPRILPPPHGLRGRGHSRSCRPCPPLLPCPEHGVDQSRRCRHGLLLCQLAPCCCHCNRRCTTLSTSTIFVVVPPSSPSPPAAGGHTSLSFIQPCPTTPPSTTTAIVDVVVVVIVDVDDPSSPPAPPPPSPPPPPPPPSQVMVQLQKPLQARLPPSAHGLDSFVSPPTVPASLVAWRLTAWYAGRTIRTTSDPRAPHSCATRGTVR
jgi:hypothetical protein